MVLPIRPMTKAPAPEQEKEKAKKSSPEKDRARAEAARKKVLSDRLDAAIRNAAVLRGYALGGDFGEYFITEIEKLEELLIDTKSKI